MCTFLNIGRAFATYSIAIRERCSGGETAAQVEAAALAGRFVATRAARARCSRACVKSNLPSARRRRMASALGNIIGGMG